MSPSHSLTDCIQDSIGVEFSLQFDWSTVMSDSDPNSNSTSQPGAPVAEAVPPGIKYAVDQIKEIAKGPASYILFIVGMAILCFILFVKYGPQLLLGRDPIQVSSLDYLGSIAAAVILLLVGANIRYAIHYQEIAKIGELEKTQLKFSMRIHADREAKVQAANANLIALQSETLANFQQRIATLEKGRSGGV